uniref:Putative secreted protein n=1 Tax=Anopheles darlingi TaxID=43151 RepID=A0A2M4D2X4_ANODA
MLIRLFVCLARFGASRSGCCCCWEDMRCSYGDSPPEKSTATGTNLSSIRHCWRGFNFYELSGMLSHRRPPPLAESSWPTYLIDYVCLSEA